MLKKILIAFATLMGLVFAVGLALPSKYRVERSTTIQAPPEAVYAYVANLRRWQDWGPWNARKYPGDQWMFGGPEVGVGAVHSWSGVDVGNGTLSLTRADPRTGVAYDMSVEHGQYLLHGRISFAPEGQGTRVTWVDEGDIGGNPLAHYLVPLIQSRLGGDFEEGLAQLKKLVEANPLPAGMKPEPAPAPVKPAPPPAEDSPAAAPPAEGSQVVASPAEGSQAPAPVEVAPPATPTTPPTGEQAPTASPGTAAPSVTPAPVEGEPAAPVPTPAPVAGETASPT